MTPEAFQKITQDLETILRELVSIATLKTGQVIVIGTSTSEVLGEKIGTSGTTEVAERIFEAALKVSKEFGLFLAFQCCEHLNRALVVEEELVSRFSLEPVTVIPVPKAGGSMAAYAYKHFARPCVVEAIEAHAGIDIGDTMIGMHLRKVAVPVRPSIRSIGKAHVTMAFTRPKLIGGARAVYSLDVTMPTTAKEVEDCQ